MSEVRAAREPITGVRGRAAVIAAPGKIDLREVEFREPVAGEVRVRIEGCGVCASNVPVWQGKPWFEYPFEPGAPGHEAWGYVDALGEGVTDLAKGERVALLSSHAFAAYDFALAAQVVQLPADLNDQPVPAEALGCAVNIFRRSHITRGQTVAIIGIGFLGTLLTQLAVNAGARVFAISRRQSSLKLAERFGASVTVEVSRARETVKLLTQHRGCDCVIEAAGTQQSLDLATELTSERGRLVIAGYHQDGPRTVDMQTWNWRGLEVINAHEREPQIYVAGMRGAIEAMQTGTLNPAPLYTHTFALDELPRAFETVAGSPEGFVKALVVV
ncbi:MAG TPA: zinc-binding dehydrogenase [Pyrinomonadaceae bacterium]|nr:zinc-binding dehydrogenase [Pyrinomonadaceae bacterium]